MAYDAKTYGQSPFGTPKPKDGSTSDGVDQGSGQAVGNSTAKSPGLASRFPNISGTPASRSTGQSGSTTSSPKSVNAASSSSGGSSGSSSGSSRKSRNISSKSTAKSKKSQATSTAKAEVETAEQAIAQRFVEEDRSAYLSLLYKTGVSGLVWAVLRLSRYELSKEAIALINIAIHPTVIAAVAFACVLGLTFWTRRLLNDLARHTQQLHTDAEAPEGKSFRPTLEIVGDALEYNPKLRKNFARLFDAASILLCSLVSYLVTFALFPTPD